MSDENEKDLNSLLLPEQIIQVRQLLVDLLGRGFGRLEIVVERSRIRRLCPVRSVRRSGPQAIYPQYAERMADEWNQWSSEIAAGLAEVMGAGWGMITIVVEHGQIGCIETAPSIPAAAPHSGRIVHTAPPP